MLCLPLFCNAQCPATPLGTSIVAEHVDNGENGADALENGAGGLAGDLGRARASFQARLACFQARLAALGHETVPCCV